MRNALFLKSIGIRLMKETAVGMTSINS